MDKTNQKSPLRPEVIVPRVGYYLVEKGVITEEDLQVALEIQRSTSTNQAVPLLGDLLIQQGKIDRATLDEAVTEQIISLRNALQTANAELEQRVQERTAELQMALNKLSELDRLKSNFVSNISHELRTPLTHIKGYIDLLLSESLGELECELKEGLEVISRASNRLGKLIDDLILFSVIETSSLQLSVDEFDLYQLAKETVEKLSSMASSKKTDILLEIPSNLPPAMGDRNRIGWVMTQLVENAIKFSPNNSMVLIQASIEGNDQVKIAIQDRGIGIEEDRLEEIFEPFHQLDGDTTRKQGGTGLGLSLAKEIIEAHDSTIEVESHPGQGSTFSFFLRTKYG